MNSNEENQDSTMSRASFGTLLSQLYTNTVALVRDEIALAIQSVSEKVGAVRRAALLLAMGAFIGLAALLCLCAALIIALTAYMSPLQAALVVGLGLALCGTVISYVGYRQLKK